MQVRRSLRTPGGLISRSATTDLCVVPTVWLSIIPIPACRPCKAATYRRLRHVYIPAFSRLDHQSGGEGSTCDMCNQVQIALSMSVQRFVWCNPGYSFHRVSVCPHYCMQPSMQRPQLVNHVCLGAMTVVVYRQRHVQVDRFEISTSSRGGATCRTSDPRNRCIQLLRQRVSHSR